MSGGAGRLAPIPITAHDRGAGHRGVHGGVAHNDGAGR